MAEAASVFMSVVLVDAAKKLRCPTKDHVV